MKWLSSLRQAATVYLRGPRPSDEEMNRRLGEFLTAMGRVENDMFRLGNLLHEGGVDDAFDEYAKLTFGPKINWLKALFGPFEFPRAYTPSGIRKAVCSVSL